MHIKLCYEQCDVTETNCGVTPTANFVELPKHYEVSYFRDGVGQLYVLLESLIFGNGTVLSHTVITNVQMCNYGNV